MTRYLIGLLLLTTAAMTGCDNESARTSTPAQREAVTVKKQAAVDTRAAVEAKVAADEKAASDAQTAAKRAAADTQAAADARIAADLKAAAAAKVAADAAATATKTAADEKVAADLKAAAVATAASDATTAKATALLAQLMQAIKDNKINLAQTSLTQLDSMKGSLSPAMQDQIESARAALAAKNTAASLMK